MAKVRLIAVNPKYRTLPFFCVPVYDDVKRAYKTGQEDLTPDQLSKEPIIIEPDTQYPIRHMEDFDTNKRKDQIILALIKTQDVVAAKASEVVAGRHLFYLQDIEAEADESVSKVDKMFEALSKVKKNTSLARQKDIAIFLGIDIAQPMSVIQDRIYRRCQDNPEEVLTFFEPGSENRIFAMKLRNYGIIQFRDGKYLDGDILVGRSIEEVVHFAQDRKNESLVVKWGLKLDKIEGVVRSPSPSGKESKKDENGGADASVNEINSETNGKGTPADQQINVTKEITDEEQTEILQLRKQLDEKGIKYHHMHRAEKLKSLLAENKD